MMNINNENGNIIYSDEVIANIVGISTMECYGVVGMASKSPKDGLWELLKGENLSKGVKVNCKDEILNIEIYIIVEYGTKISVIANNIIQKVFLKTECYISTGTRKHIDMF